MTAAAIPRLPLLLDPARLVEHLDEPDLRVVDLGPGEVFREHHVPGSVHLPYAELVTRAPPVGGLLPETSVLERVLSAAGIGPDTRVVALDAEGGGAAGRLLWTLEALGHAHVSLLDGGLHAWVNEGYPVDSGPAAAPETAGFRAAPAAPGNVAHAGDVLARLDAGDVVPLDARSAGEFEGTDVRAARGGHIPGARHFEWSRAVDRRRNLRLRPLDDLREELAGLGVTPDRDVVVYCHTHHRSALSYALLRILGHQRVSGYPGSWSDWGNRDDTPVKTGA